MRTYALALLLLAPILGKPGLLHGGVGWGTVAPAKIFNGGDPSGQAFDLTWSDWGSKVARATGKGYGFRPGGGYYSQPVGAHLQAERISTCPGGPDKPTYTRLLVSEQYRPGGSWRPYTPWTLDLCDYYRKPHSCGDTVTQWDTTCAVARDLAAAAPPKNLSFNRSGFGCEGFESEGRNDWTCTRNTAQVTFKLKR